MTLKHGSLQSLMKNKGVGMDKTLKSIDEIYDGITKKATKSIKRNARKYGIEVSCEEENDIVYAINCVISRHLRHCDLRKNIRITGTGCKPTTGVISHD
jgi:hypothetical protein